ncbi:hypothetical protein CXF78_20050 [Shewanella sp. 11B5]|uniref:hypothetical protein n=1 Tax=Shewanella sp. 11B5 TaxID=2058298 RepID=UPI000C7B4FDA|nr:hypothetical protein [Shewanella sp. 11B5]PKH98166.1 hypothetical protein CXF78_20050 [Shewanella sp. 11B5]
MDNDSSTSLPFEDEYKGYEIYVEPNPDQHNEGFSWSISKNDECLDSGLEFDIKMAIDAARKAADNYESKSN